ncbi:TetR family transcriptional regulator [Sphaerisporangium krabiense]|uniref:AcrR family transcriptional regulator n=1 Tax=Sphaerisporangium krabiense TaxID=763782 RepID=A0A7W9DPZ9_9ACTN|nr:TetR/AcrR family transcriptional regulator [Sphaerisporangium krabiense]MBB5627022.1 AcrR family transcriptional regulator [Sphaerisporangium krabiense]GII65176.1 TetR family transcriptional regulator [Sphaerisporangium krabiense]
MGEQLGLRERKKRETRQRIADIAMGLFMARGFDQVTVAEVARTADVSVNTVFNYFRTKEDLFLDRMELVEDMPSRVVRERRPGESVVAAARRAFLERLDARDWSSGMNEGADVFTRMVEQSASLTARVRELGERQEEALARTLADETDADPDDMTPWLVAAQLSAVTRRLTAHAMRRRMAGEDAERVIADLRAHAEAAFDLLEKGIGAYGAR